MQQHPKFHTQVKNMILSKPLKNYHGCFCLLYRYFQLYSSPSDWAIIQSGPPEDIRNKKDMSVCAIIVLS